MKLCCQGNGALSVRGGINRLSLALLLVLAAIILLLVLTRPSTPAEVSPPVTPAPEQVGTEEVPLPGSIGRETTTPIQGVVQIVDQLTEEHLVVSVDLVLNDTQSIRLQVGETCQLPTLDDRSLLRYELFSGGVFEVPASGHVTHSADTWTIRIPYFCRVITSIAPDQFSLIDKDTEIGILVDPQSMSRDESPASSSFEDLPLPQVRDSTFHGRMNRAARKKGSILLKLDCEPQIIPPLMVAASGDYVIGLMLSDGTAAYSPVVLNPGSEVNVFVELRPRPLLTGILLDWHGSPVPNEEVIFSTSLNLVDYDYSPRDRAGIAALKINGEVFQTTKFSVWTDEGGKFSVRMPRGLAYCAESNARGSRAFWNTRDAGLVLVDKAEIELRLEDPESETALQVVVTRENGAPFGGAEALLAIGDDVPFVRQWPRRRLDDAGTVRFLGLNIGDKFSIGLFHPSLQRTFYAVTGNIVSTDRRLTIVVPNSAFNPQ